MAERGKGAGMSITIPLPILLLISGALVLFLIALWLCWSQGMFDEGDSYGIGCVFSIAVMALVFAIPSLTGWAIYATWFKP